jgi:hypothetical protein
MQGMPTPKAHRHTAVVVHVVQQRAGVPYEVERKLCSACERLLDEKPVRRVLAA